MDNTITGNRRLKVEKLKFTPVSKFFAHFFSWIFHPLFIPFYITAFILYIHPSAHVTVNEKLKLLKLLSVAVNMVIIPAFSLFLLWRLKFIQSFFLRTQKERIIPYALVMIFYFWAWYVSYNQKENPEIFTSFLLGSFITIIAAWLANIYFKISMHALAMGGMVLFAVYISLSGEGSSGLYASISVLIAGIVCTSRMIVSDHNPLEIYAGFLIGVLCQVIAIWI